MATLKSILKNYFSAGKKPTQQHFHEWIDSFFHKKEDGLSVSDEGNIGIGTETPNARLHVAGGLKIGEVPDDSSQAVQGTLRWTGSELQIFFADEWHIVWGADQSTIGRLTIESDLKINDGSTKNSGTFSFNAATNLLQIQLVYNLDVDGNIFNPSGSTQLDIFLESTNTFTVQLGSVTVHGTRNNSTSQIVNLDLAGNISMTPNINYYLKLSLASAPNIRRINIRQIELTYRTQN